MYTKCNIIILLHKYKYNPHIGYICREHCLIMLFTFVNNDPNLMDFYFTAYLYSFVKIIDCGACY